MRIRRATLDDAAEIAAIYAPFVRDTATTFEVSPPTADEMRRRIAEIIPNYPWLVAEDDNHLAGYVYGNQHKERAAYQWSADVTIYLRPAYHRQGLGRRLYTLLFDLLRRQGFHSLYAGLTLPNAGSQALHRAMGMTEIGVYREAGWKFDSWHDVMWMGMSFDSSKAPKAPPVPFSELDIAAIDTSFGD